MNLSDVLTAINNGDLDGEANSKAIVSAINARARAISRAAGAAVAAVLKPGDRVKITGDVKPAHFRGREGNVTAFNRTKVSVRLDGDQTDTNIPPSILSKVADAEVESVEEATERLVKAYEAEHAYPQYEGVTVGATAVPLRTAFKHRGTNLPAGTLVLLLLPSSDKNPGQSTPDGWMWTEYDGRKTITIWHPNMLLQTSTVPTTVVMPKGA